jgi:AhpD family alkylhydroperoxidase
MVPAVLKSYASLHHSAMEEGELSTKTKELIGLAVAVAVKCDGCIAAHARGAARAGANRQAIAEALGVTILLTGGPGTVYGPRALEAFDEFEADYRRDEGERTSLD